MASPEPYRRKAREISLAALFACLWATLVGGCAQNNVFRDGTMDFGSVKTVAVMPLANLSKDQLAGERIRDSFNTMLMASGAIYSIPTGDVARATVAVGVANPAAPSSEEVTKLAKNLKADAIITGVVREYGDVRSGQVSADVISLSLQMAEAQEGRVVWSASSTQGGIGLTDRLFGGGGRPLSDITEKSVNDLINKLFE